MKNLLNTLLVLILILSSALSSCSSTNKLTMGVTQPAPVYLPNHIKKIGIVDRSLPSQENKKVDELDKILSAEGKNLDKDGADKAVLGLYNELIDNNIFTDVKMIENVKLRSPGSGIFPALLSWNIVQEICHKHDVDALYVLSYYDTDSKINYNTTPVKIETPIGLKVPAIEHHAKITTKVKTGWRIYNAIDKTINDEFNIIENVTLVGKGINPAKALAAIKGRKEAVLDISNNIGHNYAARILPFRIRVSRDYYVRGTNNFKIAKRRAQAGNWDGAGELWEKEITNANNKVAGRAYYNMAIINEINGDLEKAVDLASISYTDYKINKALRYTNILKNRIRNREILQLQNQ